MLIFSIQNHEVCGSDGATDSRPLDEENWQLMTVGGGSHFRVTFLQGCDPLIGCPCPIGWFNTFADMSSTNTTRGIIKTKT